MRAYLLLMLVVVFYAGNILTGKALSELPPLTIAFGRIAVAFLVLLLIGYRSAWRSRHRFIRHWKPLLLMTVTGVAGFNTLIYSALQFTSATNVSVLEASIPAVTVMLGFWLLRERLRPLQWAGVLLSLCGALWVVTNGQVLRLTEMAWNAGDGIMAIGALSWALYSIAVRRYLPLFPAHGAVLVMTGLSVLFMLPLLLAEWAVVGIPPISGGQWSGLLYLGIFPSVIALLLYNRAVATLGASQASVFLNFVPVLTMLGAYVLLGEAISLMQILGAVAVILGVFFTTRSRRVLVRNEECSSVTVEES
ncbi:DMT family transporter [Arthrobacter sp. CAU 1506]|uniref:DMT family transporter n=1 Tax=Arthrobacter sp. CAU 1506 TaxID=2560052 RepID=UPI0010ABE1D1|nr:DMT family transporter [Arthrobacter sp. CAU 1506]TJY66392.1 DMT family transporter [Arthrobacter sp. CAU 1506]